MSVKWDFSGTSDSIGKFHRDGKNSSQAKDCSSDLEPLLHHTEDTRSFGLNAYVTLLAWLVRNFSLIQFQKMAVSAEIAGRS